MPKSKFFPPLELCEPEGPVLFGGKLSPEWLLDAYSHGIFPWPIFHQTELLVWWSPEPRAIFELHRFRISRRLWRTCRTSKFQVTMNQDFAAVIAACGSAGDRRGQTWITPDIQRAYTELHRLGHAQSIEVWHEGHLIGGTYGLTLGGLYAGESMFHLERDASKVALVHLVHHLRTRGYQLFDIQQLTPHTESLGACEISRDEYLRRLDAALKLSPSFGPELTPLPEHREEVAGD